MKPIVDENRWTVYGHKVPNTVFILAEILFRHHTCIPHEVLQQAVREDRGRRGWSRVPRNFNNAIAQAISRLRKYLEGSGYDVLMIYGQGYRVVQVEQRQAA